MTVKTTLGYNLETTAVLEGRQGQIHTAYLEPRESMNPGEVLASALGACMLTMVGFMASKCKEDLAGTSVTVDPAFDEGHTRVMRIKLAFHFPAHLSAEQKAFYTEAAQKCPVHNSLREDIVYMVSSN